MARLPTLATPVLLITSAKDRAVPPDVSARAAARMPNARVAAMPAYGHLVHEEAAGDVAALILPYLAEVLAPA